MPPGRGNHHPLSANRDFSGTEHLLGHCTLLEKYRKAESVQSRVCFVNVQSYLHENVVFSVCALMCNAAYGIFVMWNSISSLEAWYHFWFNISCGVAVTVRSQQEKIQVIFQGDGRGAKKPKKIGGEGQFSRSSSFLRLLSFLLRSYWRRRGEYVQRRVCFVNIQS